MSRSKVLISSALAVAAVLTGLAALSFNSGQPSNASTQNTIEISAPDNASGYFVLQSQQDFFNTIKAGRAEEIFTNVGQAAREIKMASVTDYNITGTDGNAIRVRFYDPGVQSKPAPLVIYLYGRAGPAINMDSSDPGLRILANSTGFMVATMDYRFAPLADSVDDIVATIRWIHQNSGDLEIDPERIALGGVSRGANLALSTALILRDSDNIDEQNIVRVLYLLNGYYSPDLLENRSAKLFGNGMDPWFTTPRDIETMFDQIHQNESDLDSQSAFPILAKDLAGLPPVYIVASGIDPLRDESIELATRLQEDGQEYYLSMWPGVGHSAGSLVFIPVIPEIHGYLDSMTVYLRGVLSENKEN